MRDRYLWTPILVLVGACAPELVVATPATMPEPAAASDAGLAPAASRVASRSWPTPAQFAETEAALPRPYTLTRVDGDQDALAVAHRDGEGWVLDGLLGAERPAGCSGTPCPWPDGLVPASPLTEPAVLPASLLADVAYARTLLAFEGELDVMDEPNDGEWMSELPESTWTDPASADVAPFLERLRRFHPQGYCSMDTRPQVVAQLRARAAAQSGRTGWAVQGWMGTVGYWSSPRMVWSSYGQSHPEGHLALLQMVGVDPSRLLLGLMAQLPGGRGLYLADVRRVVPDLGAEFAARIRRFVADDALDPYTRAILFTSVASLPLTDDQQFEALPPLARALIGHWAR